MLRGMYSAASGMTNQLMRNDVMADNMANLSTAGFKSSKLTFKTFSEALISKSTSEGNQVLGGIARGANIQGQAINFKMGELLTTGNPLDVAINGDGFFKVRLPNGQEAYTRAGNFTRDQDGFLVTNQGNRVVGASGEIQIPSGATKIHIRINGDVFADNQNVGKLQVWQFQNKYAMTRLGSSLYQSSETPEMAKNYNIDQGFLEQSNANLIQEMVSSITGMRVYENLQKTIQMQNETLGKSVNDVGRVH